jgi:peptidyl-prolyl cis-trans isomerase A (cyclophilin A)
MKSSLILALYGATSLLMLAQTPPAVKKAAPAADTAVKKAAVPAKKAAAPVAKKTVEPPLPPRPDGLYVTFAITHMGQPVGKIVGRLYEKESPVTVRNFVDLAQGKKAWVNPKTGKKAAVPLYNGLTFHRVIPGFMIQGGDPQGDGTGGTDPIVDEFHPSLEFTKGGLFAMANAGPRTGSSQFFITEKATPWLNGKHTIFGEVVEGIELAGSLARVPRGPNDRPNDPIVMQKVTITRYPLGTPLWPNEVPAKKTAVPAKKSAVPAAKTPVAPKTAVPAAKKPA